jgi:PIN domain nuclease of toxin-antitoxin system
LINRYLLDTHTLLWWLDDYQKLSSHAYDAINSEKNVIYVSAAVSWEIAIKRAKGQLTFQGNVEEEIANQGFLPLSISHQHAQHVENLADIHQDPFDRIMIAQAELEKLILITHDRIILKYNNLKTLET